MEIKDKVAIITGASSGIGLATARLFAGRQAKVVLVARSTDILLELAKALPNALAIPADMSDATSIKSMVKETFEHFGRIDILINNAGRAYRASTERMDLDKYRHILDLNVLGPLIAMQEVIPIMRNQGEGAIVNISSGTTLMAIPGLGAYSSAKRALNGISLTAREELESENIVVGTVYPYMTDTAFFKNTMSDDEGRPAGGGAPGMQAPDTAEYVAELIIKAVQGGDAEIYAHDWMLNRP